ncbi:MAG TPA: hypothetical protein VG496_15890 [Myxococcales bacterium]|nr:hypothetical protein [Myxococcales bacterium]
MRGADACLIALACAALAGGCAVPRPPATADETPRFEEVVESRLNFDVRYVGDDSADAARIAARLVAAGPQLSRWGTFRHRVSIRVLPDHATLENRIGLHGYPWLRAWAFGDQILLQSPRSWTDSAASSEELAELLVHELTHALMYQLVQPSEGGFLEEPPLWFREGMASVTAQQGHRRLDADELQSWRHAHPLTDLLHPSSELYRTEKEAVYSAAHHAFERLVALNGDRAIRAILRGLRSGARFEEAFAAATGRSLSAFESDVVRSGYSVASAATPSPSGAGGP